MGNEGLRGEWGIVFNEEDFFCFRVDEDEGGKGHATTSEGRVVILSDDVVVEAGL